MIRRIAIAAVGLAALLRSTIASAWARTGTTTWLHDRVAGGIGE
jgi:hypothetical protein